MGVMGVLLRRREARAAAERRSPSPYLRMGTTAAAVIVAAVVSAVPGSYALWNDAADVDAGVVRSGTLNAAIAAGITMPTTGTSASLGNLSGMIPGESRGTTFTIRNTGNVPMQVAASRATSTNQFLTLDLAPEPCPAAPPGVVLSGTRENVGPAIAPDNNQVFCMRVTLDEGAPASLQGAAVGSFGADLAAVTGSWTRALSATGSVTAGTLTTSSTLSDVDWTVSNDDYQTTQVIGVQNPQPAGSSFTGPSTATVTINPLANTGMASLMSVSVWPVVSAAACTAATAPSSEAVSAPWTAGLTSGTAPVAPNASAYFCVRGYPTDSTPLPASPDTAAAQNRSIVAAQLGAASTLSVSPTYSGHVARGNFAASAATRGSTLSAYRIFPFHQLTAGNLYIGAPVLEDGVTGLCFNVAAGGATSPPGNDLITYTCAPDAVTPRNERFVEVPVPGTSSFQIRADSTNSTYGFLEASADGALVESQVGDAGNLRQRWIGQILSNGTRQIVNAATGYCLFAHSVNGATVTTQACNNVRGEASNWNAARP